jgi:hypothetical protein
MPVPLASLDRRAFIGSIACSAGSAAAAVMLPVSVLEAGEVCVAVGTPHYPDPCADWTLDDMCTAYPPYAFDIRRGTLRRASISAQVAAADEAWVA